MASGSKKINILIGADTRKLNAELKKSERNLQKFGRRMSLVGTDLIRSVTIPLALAGGALLKFGAELDASKRALTAIMGSSKLAAQHFLDLKEAAKAPGLDFSAAIQGSIRFQSMGVEAAKSTKILTAFGKAVSLSGGGADEFGRTIQQVSDMISRQKVTMEDWRRVITASPAVIQALRDEFDGMTDAVAIFQEVGFEEFMGRLTDRLNATEGVAGNLKNSFNNLAASSKHVAGELGLLLAKHSGLQEIIGRTVTKMDKFAVALTQNEDLAKKWGRGINIAVKALIGIAATGVITKVIGSVALLALQFKKLARAIILTAEAMTGLNMAAGGGAIAKMFGGSALGTFLARPSGFGQAGGLMGMKSVGAMMGGAIIAGLQVFGLGAAIGAIVVGAAKGASILIARSISTQRNQQAAGFLRAWAVATGTSMGFVLAESFEDEYTKRMSEAAKNASKTLDFLINQQKSAQNANLMRLMGLDPDKIANANRGIKPPINEEFTKIMDKYRDSVKQLNAEFKLTGDHAKSLESEISNLQGTIVDLEVAGFGAGKTFEELNKEFEKLVGFAEALDSLGKGDESYFEKINANMPTIRAMPTTLGADTALPGDAAAARAALLSSEIAGGINPSEEDREKQIKHLEKVAELQDRITGSAMAMGQAFAGSFVDIIDGTKTLGDAFKDFFKKLMKKLLAAIAAWTILTILSGGTSKLAGLAGGALKNIGGFGGLLGQSFGFGGFGAAEGGVTKGPTGLVTGEYVNAYNKPEMTGRVDQWAGLIRDFMSGHNMTGGQQQPELALRGEDIWRMYNRTDNRMSKMGVTG